MPKRKEPAKPCPLCGQCKTNDAELPERWLSVIQMAELIAVTKQYIYKAIATGELPARKSRGGTGLGQRSPVRVAQSDFEAWRKKMFVRR